MTMHLRASTAQYKKEVKPPQRIVHMERLSIIRKKVAMSSAFSTGYSKQSLFCDFPERVEMF